MKRFWDKVDIGGPDDCWRWRGASTPQGYGRFRYQGETRQAQRVAWEISTGEAVPDDLCACHTCDHPWCVNPAHLFLGTKGENNADRAAKGRSGATGARSGAANHGAKLSTQGVARLRQARRDGASFRELGERFGVSPATAFRIANYKSRVVS